MCVCGVYVYEFYTHMLIYIYKWVYTYTEDLICSVPPWIHVHPKPQSVFLLRNRVSGDVIS